MCMVWDYILCYYICGQLKKQTIWPLLMDAGATVSRLQSHYEETVYFKFPGLPGTHLIDLRRVKPRGDLGATLRS